MEKIKIKKVETKLEYAHSIQIRFVVFVNEQNVPVDREVDTFEDECKHYIAYIDNEPAGCVRWRDADGLAKIERLAVMKIARGCGLGKLIMDFVMDDILKLDQYDVMKLSAQDYAIPFYQKCGFQVAGNGYEDAGIPHHDMFYECKNKR